MCVLCGINRPDVLLAYAVGTIAGIATMNETILIALCLISIIPALISAIIDDGLFRCPRCGTRLQRTDVSRLHLALHPDDLPQFCQKCGRRCIKRRSNSLQMPLRYIPLDT